ncbi:acyl-homoserine-lactone synthase [Sphaerisporangium corydalis]|uniref:acyl-homoserine-lactone synthase n=1 Tax=Sphaerisporangium corydalis TaxID=1441875 RepID=A0ABV9ENX5_9ACTN|nr:acyl-homoserine-lactone synthase [Sphaerisporangium corydalis]
MDDPLPQACAQQFVIGHTGELPVWLLNGMFRLRHEVFHERLRWDVDSVHGMERDFYDDCDPVYVISHRVDLQEVTGCCRMLRTDGRYMLPEVFSELLRGGQAPRDPAIWELSRLATGRAWSRTVEAGLGPLARALLWEAFRWVDQRGEAVVAVSGVALERSVNAMGVPTRRLGDGKAARLGRVLCSAYITTTRNFLENAPPVSETEADCDGDCAATRD